MSPNKELWIPTSNSGFDKTKALDKSLDTGYFFIHGSTSWMRVELEEARLVAGFIVNFRKEDPRDHEVSAVIRF